MSELNYCPSCKFTRKQHQKAMAKWGSRGNWDVMKPIIYRNQLFNQVVIECQNCNMAVLFKMPTEGECIDLWNELPRGEEES